MSSVRSCWECITYGNLNTICSLFFSIYCVYFSSCLLPNNLVNKAGFSVIFIVSTFCGNLNIMLTFQYLQYWEFLHSLDYCSMKVSVECQPHCHAWCCFINSYSIGLTNFTNNFFSFVVFNFYIFFIKKRVLTFFYSCDERFFRPW